MIASLCVHACVYVGVYLLVCVNVSGQVPDAGLPGVGARGVRILPQDVGGERGEEGIIPHRGSRSGRTSDR